MAEVYSKAGEHLIIPGVREAYIQPFDAPTWMDLRVGFFLSVTGDTGDDATEEAGMAEVIAQPGGTAGLLPSDRYWIGLKTGQDALPRSTGVVFMGYTNSTPRQYTGGNTESLGDSQLVASDNSMLAGVTHWRANNSQNGNWCGMISDGQSFRAGFGDSFVGGAQHYAKNAATVAAGYATLHMIRFTRNSGTSKSIWMSIKRTTVIPYATDILFSNTPDIATLQTNLTTFPAGVGTIGPVQVSKVPNALYFYWPFHNSRIRIHSLGVFKYR